MPSQRKIKAIHSTVEKHNSIASRCIQLSRHFRGSEIDRGLDSVVAYIEAAAASTAALGYTIVSDVIVLAYDNTGVQTTYGIDPHLEGEVTISFLDELLSDISEAWREAKEHLGAYGNAFSSDNTLFKKLSTLKTHVETLRGFLVLDASEFDYKLSETIFNLDQAKSAAEAILTPERPGGYV